MSDHAPDLSLLGRQQHLILAEVSSMRDDTGVMMAILQRLDGTALGLVNEIRATHSQRARLDRRVRTLENVGPDAAE